MSSSSQPRLQGHHLQHPISLCHCNQQFLQTQQYDQRILSTSSLGHPRFGIVMISVLIQMDNREKWFVLINYSLKIGRVEPRPEREITFLVHIYYIYQSLWPVIHATCDSSPGIKLHPRSSLHHSERLGSPQYTIWVYGQGWLDKGNGVFRDILWIKYSQPTGPLLWWLWQRYLNTGPFLYSAPTTELFQPQMGQFT